MQHSDACFYAQQIFLGAPKRQLLYLQNSVAAYDNGCAEEAIHIGVAIRVLYHDTQFSVSLLEKMGANSYHEFIQ
jgi:hypothetical protein